MKPKAFVIAWADPVTNPEGAKRYREAPPPTHEVLWGVLDFRVYVPPELPDDMVAAAKAVRDHLNARGMSVLRLADGKREFVRPEAMRRPG